MHFLHCLFCIGRLWFSIGVFTFFIICWVHQWRQAWSLLESLWVYQVCYLYLVLTMTMDLNCLLEFHYYVFLLRGFLCIRLRLFFLWTGCGRLTRPLILLTLPKWCRGCRSLLCSRLCFNFFMKHGASQHRAEVESVHGWATCARRYAHSHPTYRWLITHGTYVVLKHKLAGIQHFALAHARSLFHRRATYDFLFVLC
jgi:hypothetical protein